jgi:hypothetical protein
MNANKKTKLVGVGLPDQLFQCLNLFSIVTGLSRSQVIRDALFRWQNKNDLYEDQLIKMTINKYELDWLRLSAKKPNADLDEYLGTCRRQLEDKQIPLRIINKIIDGLKDETNK